MVHRFCFPITLCGGILPQFRVFIFAFGAGVSCCGSNTSLRRGSGVSERAGIVVLAESRFPTGGGAGGAPGIGGGAGGPLHIVIGGGGGGGAPPATLPPTLPHPGGGGGGAGAGGGGGGGAMVVAFGLRVGLTASLRQLGQVNFCAVVVRNRRTESSWLSSRVARCTSFSVVSQTTSLTCSFGSIRNKCCSILRNGTSCGVSATYKWKVESH